MTKRTRAIELRDLAVAVVKAHGKWEPVRGSSKVLSFHDAPSEFTPSGLNIGFRTPFNPLPGPSDELKRKAAIYGERLKPSLPYALDVWAPKKVLSVAWSDEGDFEMIGYRPGERWETRLLELFADVALENTAKWARHDP